MKGGIKMRCPGNPEHEGIRVILMKDIMGSDSPHYAKAICKECRVWIKWLSRTQANHLLANDGEMDGEILSPEMEAEIRRIVREEIAKANNGENKL